MKILLLAVALLLPTTAMAESLPQVTVWKSPLCGCCGKWVEHMKNAGFAVETRDVDDVQSIKKSFGVPDKLKSCHTARVGDYVIEGHVPAEDVKRLLAEKPSVQGLATPGMPNGSPGMETGSVDPYDVQSFDGNGKTAIFSSHR